MVKLFLEIYNLLELSNGKSFSSFKLFSNQQSYQKTRFRELSKTFKQSESNKTPINFCKLPRLSFTVTFSSFLSLCLQEPNATHPAFSVNLAQNLIPFHKLTIFGSTFNCANLNCKLFLISWLNLPGNLFYIFIMRFTNI